MSQGLLIQRNDYLDPSPLWHALRAHEECAGVNAETQDSFSFGALRALAFEPLAHPSLHPEKWKQLNARLDISVRLTKKATLAMDVSPWTERCNPGATNNRFDDFVDFQGDEEAPGRSTCILFELPLDELKSELRGAVVNLDAASVSARRLLHLSYDYVLRKLALHFEVRVQTALLCLGDNCLLLMRKMSSLENPVERPGRWAQSLTWHAKYVALCAQAGVAPDELLNLYTSSLQSLAEPGRLSFLRQYLGNPPTPAVRRGRGRASRVGLDPVETLLRTLTVVASPDVFPPLMAPPSEAVQKHLLQLVRSTPLAGVASIAEAYCLDLLDVQNLLRQDYPEVLLTTLVLVPDIRGELEYTFARCPDLVEHIDKLQQQLVLQLGKVWADASRESVAGRKRKLSRAGCFRSFQEMHEWAKQYAPPMQLWLNAL